MSKLPDGLRMGAVEWALLGVLSLLWGGSFFFAKVAVGQIHPLSVVLCRVGFAAVALNLAVPVIGLRMPLTWQVWRRFLAMGVLNNAIPFSLLFWAQTHIASGVASILNATTPLFGVVLVHLFTDEERLTVHRVAGVLLGIGGVTAMLWSSLADGWHGSALAHLACLAAALSYAFAGLYGRLRLRGIPSLVTATGQLTAAALVMLPVVVLAVPHAAHPSPSGAVIGAVVALALVSTALAYVIYFRLLASAGATNLLLVTLLIPVSATVLGGLILGEQLEPQHLAGMATIGLGLLVLDGRLPALLLRRRLR